MILFVRNMDKQIQLMQDQQDKVTVGIFKSNDKVEGLLNKIDKQHSQLYDVLVRGGKNYEQQTLINDISGIQPLGRQKFEMELPMDKLMRKLINKNNNSYSRYGAKGQVDCGDWGITKKINFSVNGRDNVRIRNLGNSYYQAPKDPKITQSQPQIPIKNMLQHQNRLIKSKIAPNKQIQLNFKLQTSKITQTDNLKLNNQTHKNHPKNKLFSINLHKDKPLNTSHIIPQLNHTYIKNQNIYGSTNSKLLTINPNHLITTFLSDNDTPNNNWNPNEVFTFFTSILTNYGIEGFKEPMIKKYRNCLYFGQKMNRENSVLKQGFLWYYRRAIYMGTFGNGKKEGDGIEIDLEKKTIWKGKFSKGNKTGFFQINSPQFKYIGNLQNGYFHGGGTLTTQKSIYRGNFRAGMKNGQGQEEILHSGSYKITYKGEYIDGKFEGEGQLDNPKDQYYYKGKFKDNQLNGFGFQRNKSEEYSGEFLHGLRNGKGALKANGGQILEGIFQNGIFVKPIKLMSQKVTTLISQKVTKSLQKNKKLKKNHQPTHQSFIKKMDKYLSFQLEALSEENQQIIETMEIQSKKKLQSDSEQQQGNQISVILNQHENTLKLPFYKIS